jgi:hypothetical protein
MFKKFIINLSYIFLLSFLYVDCKSRPEETKKQLEYIDNVNIEISLAPEDNLNNIDKEDIFFTIFNKGDKNIIKLLGDVVFYNSLNEEVGRTGWYFINVNETLEKIASPDKKVKHRVLLSKDTLKLGADVAYFFAGEPEVRRKVKNAWNDLKAYAIIKKVITEENK